VAVVVFAALAISTAPAAADDTSVWAAYTAHDPEVEALDAEGERVFSAFERHPNEHTINAAIRHCRVEEALNVQIAAGIKAQASSTPTGERGKVLLIKAVDLARRGRHMYVVAFRTLKRGHARSAYHLMRVAARSHDRSRRYDARGVAVFQRLGIAPADY
jgi:hypothetical protein